MTFPFTITDLGLLGAGDRAECNAISADGLTIVGEANLTAGSGTLHATKWTVGTGQVDLGVLPGGSFSQAFGVSGDGSIIVGIGDTLAGVFGFKSINGGALASIGTLPGGSQSAAQAVSGDGTTIVGSADATAHAGVSRAMKYVGTTMTDLGVLFGGTTSQANCVSYDGSVIAGSSTKFGGATHAFVWTAGNGMQDLGVLGTGTFSEILGCSHDGSVLVGRSAATSGGVTQPIMWTAATGMVNLGTVPGGRGGIAASVSPDGLIVVGFVFDQFSQFLGYYWTAGDGIVVLPALDPTSDHWEANAICAASLTSGGVRIVGESNPGPDGSDVADRATLWSLTGAGQPPHPNVLTAATQYAAPLTPIPLGYRDVRVVIDTEWSEKGEWCVLQSYPLPMTVLAIVPEVEVGDTPTP